ncbi:sigma-70 family RNA polymerase sigma factor [Dactylosporangium sp. NBC_01737]|uniref:RNA polymerase sigma factor n=1 Tax=Dactylosporangium sp. NBC_01737 TaxID=2975959 RepID=UPI002E0F371E|nr:sigma-70 family RNA polymerase sigma factor [Dactylosporangium sp. NBC_01737]
MYDIVADTVRIEGARILATLIRTVGDVQIAEDAVQEAVIAALDAWPVTGVPPQPRAWLTVTARRKAIDILRRERARRGKEEEGTRMIDLARADLPSDAVVHDDLLRLIFTCCHPTLSPPTQVALALRTLCGLSPAQIAGVLLTTEAATEKRLTRARQKIAAAHIPYRVPPVDELPDRLPAVCGVIHSLYTAGHAPVDGAAVFDVDACAEAVRLASLLHELLPDQPTATAVLALLLLTEARRPARLDASGAVVTLDRQDRDRWDRAAINRGIALLNASLEASDRRADAYQLQAAIAAEHARAASYDGTDWPEIVRLYDLLMSVAPSPAAGLARAVAAAEASGTATGLALLADLPPSPRWHAVRADLLARAGRYAEAVQALTASLSGAATDSERRHRSQRLAELRRLA